MIQLMIKLPWKILSHKYATRNKKKSAQDNFFWLLLLFFLLHITHQKTIPFFGSFFFCFFFIIERKNKKGGKTKESEIKRTFILLSIFVFFCFFVLNENFLHQIIYIQYQRCRQQYQLKEFVAELNFQQYLQFTTLCMKPLLSSICGTKNLFQK